MSIHFRICTEADLAIVQNHVLSLYTEDLPGREMNPGKILNTFQEFASKPEKGQIIVFDLSNKVVGYAILVLFWSNEYGGDFIEVDELFVQENYRNRGIGRAFFQWLEETWSGKAVALSLQTTPTNYSAVTFYKRIGFEASPNRHLMKLL